VISAASQQDGSVNIGIFSAASGQLGSFNNNIFYNNIFSTTWGMGGSFTAGLMSCGSAIVGEPGYGLLMFVKETATLYYSIGGKGGGIRGYINAQIGDTYAMTASAKSMAAFSLSVNYDAYIYNLQTTTFSADSANAGSLTVNGVFSAASYQNSPKFPTTLYSSGMSLFVALTSVNSLVILPPAGYSALVPLYASYNYSAGAFTGTVGFSAHLNDGTAVRLGYATNSSGVMVHDYTNIIASLGTQTGKYITAVVWWLGGAGNGTVVWNGNLRAWMT
jgi:hypothetical protein